eukprot:TRINITY_DN12497_c0_g1_i1.p1 TRINITY_DN12497_c0_g1~~TRINITY_DN12497_c0_g1_i1.p1  ORF type:complete len:934 (+),score=173.85 TRINITY_DN12497_c0_g1_i1:48-2849(+)
MDKCALLLLIAVFVVNLAIRADAQSNPSRVTYKSISSDPLLFEIDVPIELAFIAAANDSTASVSHVVVWSFPADCRLSGSYSASNATIRLSCSVGGVHVFQLTRDSSVVDTISILLQSRVNCYDWYYVATDALNATNTTIGTSSVARFLTASSAPRFMYIWAIDFSAATVAEQSETAIQPASVAAQITDTFYRSGEQPVVSSVGIGFQFTSTPVYDTTKHFWRVTYVASHAGEIHITIGTRGVSVANCRIAPTSSLLFVKQFATDLLPSASAIVASSLVVRRLACQPELVVALMSQPALIISQSAFEIEQTPVQLQSGAPVRDGAMTSAGLLLLTSSELVVVNATGIRAAAFSPAVTSYAALTVNAASVCDTIEQQVGTTSVWNERVLAWESARLWVSTNAGLSFVARTATSNGLSPQQIYAAAVVPAYESDVVVVQIGGALATLQCPLNGTCIFGQTLHNGLGACPIYAEAAVDASGVVVLAGYGVMVSIDGGVTLSNITLMSRSTGVAVLECIHSVATSFDGAYAVLTASRRLFWGRFQSSTAVELQSGLAGAAAAVLNYDGAHALRVLEQSSTTGNITSRLIPVSNEVATTSGLAACPFVSAASVTPTTAVYLDMGEKSVITMTVQAQVTGTAIDMTATSTNSSILQMLLTRPNGTLVATLSEKSASYSDYATRQQKGTGRSVLSVRPQPNSLSCPASSAVAPVRIGCPPGRTLKANPSVVTASWGGGCDLFSSGAVYTGYSYSAIGCPFRAFFNTDGFQPQFAIYDGTTFVRNLTTNYAVLELNNRTDFAYNSSAVLAGCRKLPQTRESLLAQGLTWSPYTYQSCFVSNVTTTFTDAPYQVLNKTFNALLFGSGQGGLYVMRAIVVDDSTSYCTLTTDFAIWVYGAPLSSGTQAGIILGVMTLFYAMLFASFFVYRRDHDAAVKSSEDE